MRWLRCLVLIFWACWQVLGVDQEIQPIRTLYGHTGAVCSVAFSPDGKILASGGDDGLVKLWDVATGNLLRVLLRHTKSVYSVAFSPDGKMLASGSLDNTITVWEVDTGKELHTFSGHRGPVRSVVFSPDGEFIISGSGDNKIKLWETRTGRDLRTFSGHTDDVYCVAISQSGEFVVSGSLDNKIKMWEVGTGKQLYTFLGHADDVYSVALSSDDRILASGSRDKTIKLWEIMTGQEIYTFVGHEGLVYSVAFSPDGNFLASGSSDTTVKLWEVVRGRELYTLFGHTYSVYAVAFSSDGKILASGSFDGTIILWGVSVALPPNQPPVASFSLQTLLIAGVRQPRVGDRIRFDAGMSRDSDGRIVKYEWDWDSDGTYDFFTTDPVTEYRFPTPGSHQVTLRVTDDKGATATTSQVVGIAERKPPVAEFTFVPTSPSILDIVQFMDQSTDPDGTIQSWRWEFGDGTTSTERNPTKKYSKKGTFMVKLMVTDDDGLTATTTKTLTMVNVPPEALFTFSPSIPYAGKAVLFDASFSQDRDGLIKEYAWDFTEDGESDREEIRVTWIFPRPGTYLVVLTVTDEVGARSSRRELITIVEPEAIEPKEIWGVIIGVSDYADVADLQYGRADAKAFHRILTESGRILDSHIRFLVDEQATLADVRASLEWLLMVARRDDLVILFFAGRGYQGKDLPPLDEQDGLDECLVLYDSLKDALGATTLRDDELAQFLDRVQSRHVVVMFDTCFIEGQYSRGLLVRAQSPGSFLMNGWEDLNPEGKLVLGAAQNDQVAYEHPELGHGVFTYFLLQGLQGKADKNGDGRITAEEVFIYTAYEVPRFTQEHLGEVQDPWIEGRGEPKIVLFQVNLSSQGIISYEGLL